MIGIKPKTYTKPELIARLKEISAMGWVPNGRRGNAGGIGNTLEDLLGIEENNLPIPNINVATLNTLTDLANKIIRASSSENKEISRENLDSADELKKQVDLLIYKLYDLSSKEIALVEGGM